MFDWEPKKLIDLAEYLNGYAFAPEDWGAEGLPIIRIEQLKNPHAPTDFYAGKLPEKNIIDDGDLIFSWSASLFLRIWTHGKGALNQHLFKVVEKKGIDRAFLKAFIEFYLPELTKASHGSTMQHITRKELDGFTALFPSDVAEQKNIAVIIGQLDQTIEQTKAIIAKQQRIKTGLMQDLLTKGIDENGNIRSEATHEFKDSPLGRIPVEWGIHEFGSRVISSAFGPRFPATAYSELGNIALLRTTDLDGEGNIAYKKMPLARLSQKTFEPHFLANQDFLLTRSGTCGVPAVFESFNVAVIPGAFLIRFRLDTKYISPYFARFYFNWESGRHRLLDLAEGGVQKNIRGSSVNKMLFAFPSLKEQIKIINTLSAQDKATAGELNQLKKLQKVKVALMHDLLTGKVRVTDTKKPTLTPESL